MTVLPGGEVAETVLDRLSDDELRAVSLGGGRWILLEGGPAVDAMLGLVSGGVVHVLASDAHSSHGGRPVRLSPAFATLRTAGVPAARIRWMAEQAPAAIVAGAPVAPR